MIEPYTVTLTSCGRFDLLEQTLTTLLPRLDGPVIGVIIVEDSGDTRVRDVTAQFGSDISVIVNDPPLGQIKSIDRMYSQVESEWIFHCEDDWEFFESGFIEKSFIILKEDEKLSMVGLRNISDYGGTKFGPEHMTASGVRYRVAKDYPRWEQRFCGIHFNPGLRRMSDYRKIGPYAQIGRQVQEAAVSQAYSSMGYRVGLIADPVVRHIGAGRHISDPFDKRGLRYRLRRSIIKRWCKMQDKLGRLQD